MMSYYFVTRSPEVATLLDNAVVPYQQRMVFSEAVVEQQHLLLFQLLFHQFGFRLMYYVVMRLNPIR